MQVMCMFCFSKARIKLTVHDITDDLLESRKYGTCKKDEPSKGDPGY